MEQLFLILELVGTLAFAASGAITGLKKNMDVFGVCILGLTTAVGGGVIRDLLLGITPPGTFQDPIYAVVALLTSLVLFLPPHPAAPHVGPAALRLGAADYGLRGPWHFHCGGHPHCL